MDATTHPLRCRCGTVQGTVANPRSANRGICYCKDCQAFAHYLGRAGEILDARGGTDVIQILPKHLTFTRGFHSVACMRLTPKGLLRWYAACCKTPIGNTLATPKMSYIGLVHSCLEVPGQSLDDAFGPVRFCLNTKSAKGTPKPKSRGMMAMLRWVAATPVKARFNGDYKHNPLFLAPRNNPIVTPRVLSSAEHARLTNAVDADA